MSVENRPVNELRPRIVNWLRAIGVIGCFLAVIPFFESRGGTTADAAMMKHLQANPDHMPFTETYRFGWSSSPLFEYRKEQRLEAKADGGFAVGATTAFRIGWISWSSISMAIGIGLVVLAAKLRRKPAKSEG